MEITLDKIKLKTTEEKPCKVTLSVQIPEEFIKAKREEVSGQFQKAAQLPGFRAGKAPLQLIQKNFSVKIQSEVLNQLLKDSVPQIIKEKSLYPITSPSIDKIQFNAEKSLTFDLIIERSPEFKAKNYKNIAVTRKIFSVTDQDVEKELNELRERNSQLIPSQSKKASKELFAVISFQGFAGGQAVSELKGEHQLLDLSAPQSIEGFAEGVIGLSIEESKEVTVQFPKEHPNKNLAGNPVVFKIKLEDIKEKQVPVLDDEFAKDLGSNNLDDLKMKIRESLKNSKNKSSDSEVEKQILSHLTDENPIPVPDSIVNMQLDSMLNRAKELMARQGIKNEKDGDNPELKEKYRPQAERQVRISYLLSAIAAQEFLKATQEDLNSELEKAKQTNPNATAQIEEYFKNHASNILGQLSDEKVLKFLVEKAKTKVINE